jgi:hypothetical protein
MCLFFCYATSASFSYDHQERLTAQEAMAHPFFEEVRANELSGDTSK